MTALGSLEDNLSGGTDKGEDSGNSNCVVFEVTEDCPTVLGSLEDWTIEDLGGDCLTARSLEDPISEDIGEDEEPPGKEYDIIEDCLTEDLSEEEDPSGKENDII